MHFSWNRNRLTDLLGIDYPIVQGPFGGLPSQRLTAQVSNFGGLGSFGAHGLAPPAIHDAIAEIRSLTSKPFAMNLWVSMEDEGAWTSDESAFNRSLAPLARHFAALGAPPPAYKPYSAVRFEDQARVLLDANVPAFSFIFGIPPKEILQECRARKIVTIGAATTPDEAVLLQDAGVDAIAASGFEAGGHRGSFLRPAEDSLTGTFSLVPQIADIVDAPVIAAGGIADARGVIAALALGAEAVQMGTVFLTCEESGASQLHRVALLGKKAGRTALTKGFTGRLARGISNPLMDDLNRKGTGILPYPLQRGLLKPLSAAADAAGRADLLPMWAGQSANISTCTDVADFLRALVEEIAEIAGLVTQWSAGHRGRRSNPKANLPHSTLPHSTTAG
jgi:nitronate monooxygenase